MKKTSFKFIVLSLLLWLSLPPIYGQAVEENQEVRNFLDNMFQHLDKSKVPKGLLSDYAFELVELDRFNGYQLNENNYTDRETYELLLRTIRSSAVGTKPFGNVNDILTNQYNAGNTTTISLSGLAFQYSKIKSNALTSNLIRYENNKVYDNTIGGVWQNPYESKYVVGICAQDSIFEGSAFTFKLNSNCWFSNLSYKSIEIDPDGKGYKTLSLGGSLNVSYSEGPHIIRLRVNLTDGNQLYAHTVINTQNKALTRALIPVHKIITGTPYKGFTTQAELSIKFASIDGKIRKPFIVVEGFDPRVIKGKNGKGANDYSSFGKELERMEDFMGKPGAVSSQYDIIYVDWVNSEQFLQANSNTLQEVIKWINSQKALNGSTAPNIVYGHSMGGVVARHALRTMENANIAHQTSHYISHDAPHLGAHLPLGALYAVYGVLSFLENKPVIDYFANKYLDSGTYIEFVEKIAHCSAAQQLLVNYVDVSGVLNNTEYNLWQKELAALGFPQGDGIRDFRMLGLANGSYTTGEIPSSYLKTDFSASSDILYLLPSVTGYALTFLLQDIWSGLLTLLPGKSTLKGHVEINPGTTPGAKITDISVKYVKKFAWVSNISKTIFAISKNMPNGLMYDLFPSSRFPTDFGLKPINEGWPIIGQISADIDMVKDIPFVPTSSALCVGGGLQTLTASMFTSDPGMNNTPFGGNYIIHPIMSVSHIGIPAQLLEWLVSQLNLAIDGPKLGKTGSKYTVPNSGALSVTWSTSNTSIATINQSGILSAVGTGIVNVIAKVGTTQITKEILVGTPRFVLANPTREPGFYRVKAQCIESDAIKKIVEGNKGIIVYEWGIKTDTEPLKWIKSDSPELLISTLEETENTTIYLKILDMHGNESLPVYVRISGYDIYSLEYNTLIFNKNGVVYTDKGVQLSYAYGTMPLTFRSTSYGEFSNAKWSPAAGVVVNDENIPRAIPWVRVGYLRDIISKDDLDRILTFTNNKIAIYRLMLLNYDRQIIQKTPITIIYRANFPN